MQSLLVYADFDWLGSPQFIGTLHYESLRGSDSYGFSFDKDWIHKYGSLHLSEDLNNYMGWQYTQPGKDIFGCFADALPDRWGRTLINRCEQIEAMEEKRPVRRLGSFDYLLGIDDYTRMGGLRFKATADGPFICAGNNLSIPPLTNIRELILASQEIEESEDKDMLPDKKWINQLIQPESSLGGARPKAGVIDDKGVLYVAKFPSRKDDYDVALWEHFCHLLAANAGVRTAESWVLSAGGKYHSLLSRRFDRTSDGHRIHFASAMTLLGLTVGCNADTGNGYLDIVDFIVQNCCDVEFNLRELYRRVAFNVCVGNSDDHFRNHGFLLTRRGWTLAPAYDMNPTVNEYQSILITASSNRAELSLLLEAAEDYMLVSSEARSIIGEVVAAVKDWRILARKLGIVQRECQLFEHRLGTKVL